MRRVLPPVFVCMTMARRSSSMFVAVCVLAVCVCLSVCEPITLRLSGEKRKHYEGRVEVYYGGAWGTVCDDDFDLNAAQVVCRQLGYLGAVSWFPSAKYGKGEGPIWLDNVHCTGREASISDCHSNGFGVSDCKHSEDVGVVCTQKRIPGFKHISVASNDGEKPWVDKTVRDALRSRSATYNLGLASGNMDEYKAASYSMRRVEKEAKVYENKLESQFHQSGSRSLWQGLITTTDYRTPSSRTVNADASLADELNTFYAVEAAAHSANGISSANSAIGSTHAENSGEENAFIILEHDVRKAFRRVNTRKAAGPDGNTCWVLKACADQFAPVFAKIFNLSLEQSMIPMSTIVPVPKKPQPTYLNGYCPVALTSVHWGKHISPSITLNTGAPQGCVLSPLLYSLYTYDCVATSSSTNIIKFADDTAVVGLIYNSNEAAYLEEIKNLETWCQDDNIVLNISKTKELIMDFSTKQERNYQPLIINGTPVERVDSFRYLGVHITQDLSWSCHVNTLLKKARQRLYHLRCLKDFKLPTKTLDVRVEDVRIRATYSHRKRIPITEGFVELKDEGKWRQICNENWTTQNSRVVCGMYGFPGVKGFNTKAYKLLSQRRKKNYFGFSVNCTGNEAHLTECKMGKALKVLKNLNATCAHGMPAVISCVPGRAFAPTQSSGFRKAYRAEFPTQRRKGSVHRVDYKSSFFLFLQQPLVRLRGGAKLGEGRVEVLKNGIWGTVCDDNWDMKAASVVCRELGFGSAKEALTGARMGQGMGPVHMNEVECSGFEKSLTECYFNKEALGCSHEEDAAVKCNIPAMGFQNRLRLSGGRNPYEGRVEVLAERNGSMVWGTVCSDSWGIMEAMVVCRQLGYGFANHAFQETWYWQGEVGADAVMMSGVRCSGTEMTLAQCLHHGKHVTCPKGGGRFAAGVSCTASAPDLVLNAEVVEHTTYLEDRPMYALQCAHEEQCLSKSASSADPSSYRRLLRFSSQIHNNGHSDFRPRTGPHAWVWHDCHRHYHSMEVFTHYDLLSLNGTKVAEGHKASFCLEDSECVEGIHKHYACANFGAQGITVGCWDTYRHDIDCQWIDITDVKPGDYIFQVVINPNYEVAESDFTNNIMRCKCRYDGYRIWTYNCQTGGSRSSDVDEYTGLMTNQLQRR
ncbi:hypothetical protein QTP86_021062 [Hemibagrus guttatus]|nr:hypothetical protein QTP86_021062 [Hemibagrus guttatus]